MSHQKFYVEEIVESCDLREDYFSYKQNRVRDSVSLSHEHEHYVIMLIVRLIGSCS